MKNRFLITVFILIFSSTIIGGYVHHRNRQSTEPAQVQTHSDVENSFIEAYRLIENYYNGNIDAEALTKLSVQGMLHALDPHSNFFDKREFYEMQSEQQSRFYGIGVTINRRNGRVYVLSAIEGTPAERAGLRYGDAIIAVDDQPSSDWSTEEVLKRVRGPRGEPVELTIERAGEPRSLKFKIIRDAVPFPAIRNTFMIRPGVGYIALTGGFNSTTDDELSEAIKNLRRQGMGQLVLDLRNNPGGLLDQAIAVAEKFLPANQKLLTVRGREFPEREFKSRNTSPEDMPLVVLINRGTASSSEIVAGAIQDHDRGLVVGETSFGKGLVQTVFRMPFGTGLLLTTAKYYTPAGRLIQREYVGSSFYDYYTQRYASVADSTLQTLPRRGEALRTDLGRTVYGGGGITPDIEVKSPEGDPIRAQLFGATFEFARQVAAGRIDGLESYKITKTKYNHKLRGDEFPITDRVIAAFRDFLQKSQQFKSIESHITPNLDYVRARIREELVTAAYGTEVGNQVFLETDIQTIRAIEALPQARQLAESIQPAMKFKDNYRD